jgi:hypothetical protein
LANRRSAVAPHEGDAYSSTIDSEFNKRSVPQQPVSAKDLIMNTSNSFPQAHTFTTVASLGMAFVLTVAMLFSVNTLATSDVAPQQMAQVPSARA